MLEEITLSSISKINGNKEPSVEAIEWYINKTNSANKKSVKDIILNFINIQTSLAFLYPYQNIYDTQGSQTLVGFIKKQDFSLQLEALKEIYSKVLLMRCDNNCYLCRVSEPFPDSIEVFENLYKEGQLNKYLSYFCLKILKDDCTSQTAYRYIVKDETENATFKLIVKDLQEDNFIDYLLNNTDVYKLQCKALPASGFSLKDINEDVYIKAFSKLVNNLSIRILEDTIDNKDCFIKHLIWE